MKRIVLLSAACAVLVACQDQRSPTGVKPPWALLRDGANNAGNPHFFFLPPLVSQPSVSGVFNPNLKPIVVICELDVSKNPAACSGAPPINPGPVTADLTGQQYKVNWDTRQSGISVDKFYRIQVFGSPNGLLLGFADVDPVSNGSELKNLSTGDFIGLVDGRTLPIKFRIELGAFATSGRCIDCAEQTVTNTGATFATNTGFAGALFPAGWLPNGFDQVVVTIERVTVDNSSTDPSQRCIPFDQTQFEGCYRFRTNPDVGNFARTVTVGVCLTLPESDPRHSALQLFSVEEPIGESPDIRVLPNAPAPFVQCEGFASAGSKASPFGNFARWLGHWLSPRQLFAAHLGAGGLTGSFSRIGWAAPPSPSGVLYGVNSGDDGLSTMDPATGAETFIGRLGGENLALFTTPVAMAVRPSDGTVFVWNNSGDGATAGAATGDLLAVDTCTAAAAQVNTEASGVGLQALAFANGTLYGADNQLFSISASTGVPTLIGAIGLRVGGMDADARGTLYGVELTISSQQRLVRIDPATGAATVVAALSQDIGRIGSIVFDAATGIFLGTGFGGPSGDILFDLDQASGTVSNVRSVTGGTAPQGLGFTAACPPSGIR
jgi:hypothetical protein